MFLWCNELNVWFQKKSSLQPKERTMKALCQMIAAAMAPQTSLYPRLKYNNLQKTTNYGMAIRQLTHNWKNNHRIMPSSRIIQVNQRKTPQGTEWRDEKTKSLRKMQVARVRKKHNRQLELLDLSSWRFKGRVSATHTTVRARVIHAVLTVQHLPMPSPLQWSQHSTRICRHPLKRIALTSRSLIRGRLTPSLPPYRQLCRILHLQSLQPYWAAAAGAVATAALSAVMVQTVWSSSRPRWWRETRHVSKPLNHFL